MTTTSVNLQTGLGLFRSVRHIRLNCFSFPSKTYLVKQFDAEELMRMQRGNRLAQKADYPAFGLIGSRSYDGAMPGDKTLAQSAQMYHFHLQKQQMMSLKQRNECKIPESGATSDEETEDRDFTVYECPGLAPTGEMEVKNPLFDDTTFHLNLQRSYN